jgi:hypothetical protein
MMKVDKVFTTRVMDHIYIRCVRVIIYLVININRLGLFGRKHRKCLKDGLRNSVLLPMQE